MVAGPANCCYGRKVEKSFYFLVCVPGFLTRSKRIVISMGHRMALSNIVLYRACKKITNIFRRGRVRGPAEVWAGPLSGARESGRRQGSTILPGSS